MHGNVWPENVKISLEDAKVFVVESDADLTNFGLLSLFFENRILAHIIATTWFQERVYSATSPTEMSCHMVCSSLGSSPTRIIMDLFVDISQFKPVVINATYDARTFSTMGRRINSDNNLEHTVRGSIQKGGATQRQNRGVQLHHIVTVVIIKKGEIVILYYFG
ncbi:hypothetical protein RDI58_014614 [Solanum bulbocastanum]|uniref:Uncharacterized protein n=1 Tax=Solanum bulbocastanum TaxID=147425 RepID=A0AAN8TDS4_SOLBU